MYERRRFNSTPPQRHHRITHVVFQSTPERRKVLADMQDFQIAGREWKMWDSSMSMRDSISLSQRLYAHFSVEKWIPGSV